MFSLTAIVGLVLDLLILLGLVEIAGMHYIFAATLAFAIAAIAEYTLDRKWSFKDSNAEIKKGFISFIIIAIFTIILISLGLWVLVELFHMYYLTSRIVIMPIIGTINFILNYAITFEMKEELIGGKNHSH